MEGREELKGCGGDYSGGVGKWVSGSCAVCCRVIKLVVAGGVGRGWTYREL